MQETQYAGSTFLSFDVFPRKPQGAALDLRRRLMFTKDHWRIMNRPMVRLLQALERQTETWISWKKLGQIHGMDTNSAQTVSEEIIDWFSSNNVDSPLVTGSKGIRWSRTILEESGVVKQDFSPEVVRIFGSSLEWGTASLCKRLLERSPARLYVIHGAEGTAPDEGLEPGVADVVVVSGDRLAQPSLYKSLNKAGTVLVMGQSYWEGKERQLQLHPLSEVAAARTFVDYAVEGSPSFLLFEGQESPLRDLLSFANGDVGVLRVFASRVNAIPLEAIVDRVVEFTALEGPKELSETILFRWSFGLFRVWEKRLLYILAHLEPWVEASWLAARLPDTFLDVLDPDESLRRFQARGFLVEFDAGLFFMPATVRRAIQTWERAGFLNPLIAELRQRWEHPGCR